MSMFTLSSEKMIPWSCTIEPVTAVLEGGDPFPDGKWLENVKLGWDFV